MWCDQLLLALNEQKHLHQYFILFNSELLTFLSRNNVVNNTDCLVTVKCSAGKRWILKPPTQSNGRLSWTSVAPQQDNIPSDTTKTAQEHDKELKMSTLTPDPLDPNPKEHWVTKSDPCRPHLQSTGIQASASELCLSGCKPPPWF